MRTIIDNNILIAEFMGYQSETKKSVGAKLLDNVYHWDTNKKLYYYIQGDWHAEDYLLFHIDWNWMMEVVDKIEEFLDYDGQARYNVNIEQTFVKIIDQSSKTIADTDANTKIRATYIAVIHFIKYYNNDNNRN